MSVYNTRSITAAPVYHDENMFTATANHNHHQQPILKKQAIIAPLHQQQRSALTDMSGRLTNGVTVASRQQQLKPSTLLQSVLQPTTHTRTTHKIIIQSKAPATLQPLSVNTALETDNIDAMLISPPPVAKTVQHYVPAIKPLVMNIPADLPNQLSTSHLYATEYAHEILNNMFDRQCLRHVNNTYMTGVQHDINAKMREILIDWLHEVSSRFKLSAQTMHLTVNLVDRFLARQPVMRNKLQLVGCASMLIASKYEEIYVPEINDFVHISDNAYTRQQIIDCEQLILSTLDFNVTTQSAMSFAERFVLYVSGVPAESQQWWYLMYVCQLALQNYDMLQYKPSTIAAAALYITLQTLNQAHQWNGQMESELHIEGVQFKRCVFDLSTLVANISAAKYGAVTRKFARSMYKNASALSNLTQPIMY